jgi:amino acid transporter
MAPRKFQNKVGILIVAAIIVLVVPSLGMVFGMKNFDRLIYVAMPVLLIFLVSILRRSGRGDSREKSNPHINKELIEKLEKLEKIEEYENRPDRDKQIP